MAERDLLSRRSFLKVGLGGAVEIAKHSSPTLAFLLETDPTQQQADSLKREIENRRGVVFLTVREAYARAGRTFPSEKEYLDPQAWDMSRLQLADESLGVLPRSFLAQSPQGEPWWIILYNFYQSRCCSRTPPLEGSRIESWGRGIALSTIQFIPTHRERSFEEITHEFTHGRTVQNASEALPGYYGFYQRNLDRIFGGNYFSRARDFYLSKARSSLEEIRRRNSQYANRHLTLLEEDDYHYFDTLEYGLRDENGREFIAILAQHYVHGRTYFRRNAEFFNGTIEQELYTLMKDAVFDGVVYEQIPIR